MFTIKQLQYVREHDDTSLRAHVDLEFNSWEIENGSLEPYRTIMENGHVIDIDGFLIQTQQSSGTFTDEDAAYWVKRSRSAIEFITNPSDKIKQLHRITWEL